MLRSIIDFILFSNIYIAIGAFLLVLADAVQLGQTELPYKLAFFVGSSTLLSYNLHRLLDLKTAKKKSYGYILNWSQSKHNILLSIFILSILISFILIFTFNYKVILTTTLIGICTIFYSIPISKNGLRLRDIGATKIFWISSVWTISTLVLCYFNSDNSSSQVHGLDFFLLLLERFIFFFCITIPFDIRDIEYDRDEGLKTIPLLIGTKKAIYLSIGLLSTLAIINLKLFPFYMLVILLVYFADKIKSDYYFTGIIDGTIILYAASVLFLQNI